MRHAFAVLCLTATLTTAACVPPGEGVPFDAVLAVKNTLDLVAPEELVLRDEEAWCDFWDRAHSALTEPPPCEVDVADFDHETILAVTMGARPAGCYDIWIDRIETGRAPGSLTVYAYEQLPGAGCICTQSITTPAQAVVVENSAGEVDFVREAVTLQCE